MRGVLFATCLIYVDLQMHNVSVREVQCLNAADSEILAGAGEANGGNPATCGRNCDTSASPIGLAFEEHRVAATRAGNRVVAMGTDEKLVIVATANERAAAISRATRASGIDGVVVASSKQMFMFVATGIQHIIVAASDKMFASSRTVLQSTRR